MSMRKFVYILINFSLRTFSNLCYFKNVLIYLAMTVIKVFWNKNVNKSAVRASQTHNFPDVRFNEYIRPKKDDLTN